VTNPAFSANIALPFWRRALEHPLFLGLLLLAPVVFLLPPLPIDETRYLAVAWEMRQNGDFLVPHLNGATYAHKPPLLFWLINAGWLITGVQAWTARAMTLLCSALSLLLLQRLSLRLTASETTARASMWFLLGAIHFAAFANAIMFDVPLTTCVLLALHGVLDLAAGRARRGVLVAGVAIGLGILVKGPVMLLDIAFPALFAPWWYSALGERRGRYFGNFGLAVLLGAAIALAWAIPAALHGGSEYAHAIFLNQTFDRIEATRDISTHARPIWWYLAVFPLMLLPWPLAIRGAWTKLRALGDNGAWRFGLVWAIPTFIAFSLIGGKQPHYLLPIIPAVALLLAFAVERGALRVRAGLTGVVLIALGIVMALLPHFSFARPVLAYVGQIAPVWGVAVAALGLALLVLRRRLSAPMWPALAMVAVSLLVKLAILGGTGQRYDLDAIAARIREAQQHGQPIMHMGWHHGVYEFAGRLTQPLETLDSEAQFATWAQQHPDGLVVTSYRRYRFRAAPVYAQRFRGGEVSIWTARDALASGIDPTIAHTAASGEDAGDE
jgi:4-amino-4-deoxy-L-arabinose transferase-like glycosyltransferase